jgi:alanine racemase
MLKSTLRFTLSEWQNSVGGALVVMSPENIAFHEIAYDTRLIKDGVHSLFVALKGDLQDGNDYVQKAYDAGVRNFLVNKMLPSKIVDSVNMLIVDNPLEALQKIAAFHRSKSNACLVGITGSNGKTIVKEWLKIMLSQKFNVMASPKSFNSQLGVPLSVLRIEPQHEFAIIEAGISKQGEMKILEQIIRPDIAILTNIGAPHAEHFPNMQSKLDEKCALFEHANTLICSSEQAMIASKMMSIKHFHPQLNLVTWGSHSGDNLRIIKQSDANGITVMELIYNDELLHFNIPFQDNASIENAMHVILLALLKEMPVAMIQSGLNLLSPLEMRLELKHGKNNCLLINDSYSADIDSLRIALDFAVRQKSKKSLTAIISDFAESDMDAQTLYQTIASLLNQYDVKKLISIGSFSSQLKEYFQGNYHHYPSVSHLLGALPELHFVNELILIKGARSFEFERIASRLEEKSHDTLLEINLSAMLDNLNVYRKLLKSEVKTMAMVKAFAYGSGSYEVASLLEHHGVNYLAVAYADEGIALREAGIKLPIMVMSSDARQIMEMLQHQLEPEIYSFNILNSLLQCLKELSYNAKAAIHIKLDTGMHRLGFTEGEIKGLIELLKQSAQYLEVKSIFSHLSSSGNSTQDHITNQQVESFDRMSKQIIASLNYKPVRHILNTSGIARFPDAQFDMVRLGIGLYGIGDETEQPYLRAVSRLSSKVIQIKELSKDDKLGYNGLGVMPSDGKTATVAIGYADGLLRGLGNGKFSLKIGNDKAPIIGSICMDMCMVNVSDIHQVKEGDRVIVFESAEDIRLMAKLLNTIPYEILTGISSRVKRVYYQD